MAGTEPADRSTQDLRSRLRDAAIEAERGTGVHESSTEKARRHIVVRIGIIAVGTVVLLAGLVMMVLPGPGIVAILAGLGILAQELPWAERLITRLRERTKIDRVNTQPWWVRVVLVLATVAGLGASVAYVFTR